MKSTRGRSLISTSQKDIPEKMFALELHHRAYRANSRKQSVTRMDVDEVEDVGEAKAYSINNVRWSLGSLSLYQDSVNAVAQEKALRIHLITDRILHRLGFYDLKCLRLVNKNWSVIASNEMMKRGCRDLSFFAGFGTKVNKPAHDKLKRFNQMMDGRIQTFSGDTINRWKGKKEEFRRLNELLEQQQKGQNDFISFPPSHFKLEGLLDSPQMEYLLNLNYHNIKVLELNESTWDKKHTRPHPIPKILQQVPSVEELHLSSCRSPCDLDLSLPSLRVFSSPSYPVRDTDTTRSSLASTILMGSPNLEEIRHVKLHNIGFFVKSGKIQLVTELRFGIHQEMFKDLDTTQLQQLTALKVLSIKFLYEYKGTDVNGVKICEAISTIMERSKNTLEELHVQPLSQLTSIRYPQLSALIHLKILGCADETKHIVWLVPTRIFPAGLDLKQTFPNLSVVTMQLMDYGDDIWGAYFPPDVPLAEKFERVSRLEMYVQNKRNVWTTQVLTRIDAWFPTLIDLRLYGYLRASLLPMIFDTWKGSQLESLEYYDFTLADYGSDFYIYAYFDRGLGFDYLSAITGISLDNCKRLVESGKNSDDCLNRLRTGPSLLNLTGLKRFKTLQILLPELKVLFPTKIQRTIRTLAMTPLSFVRWSTFDMMPKTQVTLKEYRKFNENFPRSDW